MITLCAVTLSIIYFVWKELFAIMYNRKMAEADGINTKIFIYLIILLSGVVITLSLKLVGGLLIYALLFNPASTALQFLDDMRKVVLASPVIGVSTNLLGLATSLILDLPVGSCIVLVSTIVFALSVAASPKRRRSLLGEGG
jgi:ABC-type Mn2+/Zn2+ transport system permease subunit